MDAKLLTMIAGVILSLAFSYIPKLKTWFENQSPNTKRLVMLGAIALAAGGAFGLACLGRFDGLACTQAGAWDIVELLFLAAIANQTAYKLTPTG